MVCNSLGVRELKGIADLNYKELDSLSLEEKSNLLMEEYRIYEINSVLQYEISELNEKKIIRLLESIIEAEANFQITQEGEYPAKLVADVASHSDFNEDEFFEYLKILFLNDYIDVFKDEDFPVAKESKNVIIENNPDLTYQLRYNLHRLYRNNRELFNEENFSGIENYNSESQMYYSFLKYGTIVEKICSYQTLIRLSNKGMHYLHFITSKRSVELMHKHEKTLVAITEAKEKQESLLETFENYKTEQDENIGSINNLINNHSSKIENFYKDITTIISLMLAAFALIGVNISAIPKIESNFTANLLAINLSLILCLLVLFYILRVIVYNSKIDNNHFYIILVITIVGIIGVFVFLGFNHESKIEVIEKKYQHMLNDYKDDNEENISSLEEQIKKLEQKLEGN